MWSGARLEETEIHVFRVILKPSLDEQACARSITHTGQLTVVNRALTWSPNKDLLHPLYVLIQKGDPFHLQRPTGPGSVMGAPLLGNCRCPPLLGPPEKCVWSHS